MEQQLRWWDYWSKGIDNGIMHEPPITFCMMACARKGHVSAKSRGEALDDLNAKPRTAKNTIYFDVERPSAPILPVVNEAL